jgi:hypothetical protein
MKFDHPTDAVTSIGLWGQARVGRCDSARHGAYLPSAARQVIDDLAAPWCTWV